MDCGALGGLLRSSEIYELPFWVILGYFRAFRVRVGSKKYEMDSLKYTNIEQYYVYYDLTNKPTSRPIRLFVYNVIGLSLVGLSGSKQTMFMNMFVYLTSCSRVDLHCTIQLPIQPSSRYHGLRARCPPTFLSSILPHANDARWKVSSRDP
jgi:hypothetical protein